MLMAAAYAGCDASLVGIYFIVSNGAQGLLAVSTFIVPMDLSPNYAGTIMAVTNGIGSMVAIMEPMIFGALAPNVSKRCSALVYFFIFHFCSYILVIDERMANRVLADVWHTHV